MPSIIEGYNYDIFISYRQKDNKGDMWVSEFVEALKTELESTFKEEVSVYFDINPHDGLLETHDVDESLKEKLKCLVFIPIISRTYCDPKAFAWEHEFKAFVEQASQDKFGLKVKLPGGNVANRVLPVQIHELDSDDKKMVEDELGGHLRGIEFIYKSSGINRPLLPKEENLQDNLNHTNFRDQINKVANAIKEIITAIRHYSPEQEEAQKGITKPAPVLPKSRKATIIVGSVIVLALIILGFIFIPKLLKPSEELEKSIAVLPFKNDSPEASEENTPFVNGLMEEILINLQTIREFRVLGRTSVEQFRDNTDKTIPEIARVLDVNYIVEGSVQKYGDKFRLRVQLIRAKDKETHLWAKSYEQEIESTKDIFNIQSQIAELIASELKVTLTPNEKQLIEKTPTTNLTAYDFYQRGREEYSKYWVNSNDMEALERAEILYHKSLEYDPKFALSYTGLARIYFDKNYWKEFFNENFLDSVLVLCDIALSFNENDYETYIVRGNLYRARGVINKALEEYDQALRINPNSWEAYYGKGQLYYYNDQIKKIENTLKSISLNRGAQLPTLYLEIAHAYAFTGFPEKSNYYIKEAFNLNGDSVQFLVNSGANIELLTKRAYLIDSTSTDLLFSIGYSYFFNEQYKESLIYFKKYINKISTIPEKNEQAGSQLGSFHRIGYAYLQNGFKKEGEYYINKQFQNCLNIVRLGRLRSALMYYDLAAIYAYKGDKDKAYENLEVFKQNQYIESWVVPTIKIDPFFASIRKEPEFQQIIRDFETMFQAEHERVRKWLEEQGML